MSWCNGCGKWIVVIAGAATVYTSDGEHRHWHVELADYPVRSAIGSYATSSGALISGTITFTSGSS